MPGQAPGAVAMTEIPEQQADLQELREAVRKAVQAGGNLQGIWTRRGFAG